MNIVYYHNLGIDLDTLSQAYLRCPPRGLEDKKEWVNFLWYGKTRSFEWSDFPYFRANIYYKNVLYNKPTLLVLFQAGMSNREFAFLINNYFHECN